MLLGLKTEQYSGETESGTLSPQEPRGPRSHNVRTDLGDNFISHYRIQFYMIPASQLVCRYFWGPETRGLSSDHWSEAGQCPVQRSPLKSPQGRAQPASSPHKQLCFLQPRHSGPQKPPPRSCLRTEPLSFHPVPTAP